MARKSAVLTAEGKKLALTQSLASVKEAKTTLAAATQKHKGLTKEHSVASRVADKASDARLKEILRADKEVARATARHEIVTKAHTDLKASPIADAAPVARRPRFVATPPPAAVTSALTAPTTVQ